MREVNVYYWREKQSENWYSVWVRDSVTDEVVDSGMWHISNIGDINFHVHYRAANQGNHLDIKSIKCSYHPKQIDQVKLREYETGEKPKSYQIIGPPPDGFRGSVAATYPAQLGKSFGISMDIDFNCIDPIQMVFTGANVFTADKVKEISEIISHSILGDSCGAFIPEPPLLASLQKENQRLTSECLELRNVNNEINGRIVQLCDKCDSICDLMTRKLAEKNSVIDSLNDEASQRVAEIARLNTELLATRGSVKNLEFINSGLSKHVDDLETKLVQYRSEINGIKQRIANAIRE